MKKELLLWIFIAIPLLLVLWNWESFPDQVPTHFDINGEPDAYGSKYIGLFIIPASQIFVYLLFLAIPRIDPRGDNLKMNQGKLKSLQLIIQAFLVYVMLIITLPQIGYELQNANLIVLGLILLFMLMGNYFYSIRHNYMIGIRTPWTLASEEVWVKTHRLTAKVWMGLSLVALVFFFLLEPEHLEDMMFAYISLLVAIPFIYSFVIFQRQRKENHE